MRVGNFFGSGTGNLQVPSIATAGTTAFVVGTGSNNTVRDADAGGIGDWESRVIANLKFVATASSDFGPAMAVLNINETSSFRSRNAVLSWDGTGTNFGGTANGISFSEAYVSVGDQTVISAGRMSTGFEHGTDTPYNKLGLFGTTQPAIVGGGSYLSAGVQINDGISGTDIRFGGDSVRVTSSFGDGFYGSLGLENISDTGGLAALNRVRAGTAVGVIGYKGDMLTAHLSGAAGGVLDGAVEWWAMHAGAELTIDNFKLLGALAANNSGWWQGMVTGQATFDMFTLALSGEFDSQNEFGFGGSIAADVTDTIEVWLGANWFDTSAAAGDETFRVALGASAAVTETITLAGSVGAYFTGAGVVGNPSDTTPYVEARATWAPGGGFSTYLDGEMYFTDATPGFIVEYGAKKSFK